MPMASIECSATGAEMAMRRRSPAQSRAADSVDEIWMKPFRAGTVTLCCLAGNLGSTRQAREFLSKGHRGRRHGSQPRGLRARFPGAPA
jgi:hypothetical protein